MIFFTQNEWRTTFVRTTLVVFTCIVLGAALHFTWYAPGPVQACPSCGSRATEFYRNTEQNKYTVALTFDDGPNPSATPLILDTLDKHDVQATFFILGQLAVREPSMVNEISNRGHLIGNHSFTHSEDAQSTRDRVAWELNMNSKVIESIVAKTPLMYRPPYLLDMDAYVAMPLLEDHTAWPWVEEMGYVTVGSDLDSFDWQAKTPDDVVTSVRSLLDDLESGAHGTNRHIFLFHDLPNTAAALDEALSLIKERGYTVVPLPELLNMSVAQVQPHAGTSVHSTWTGIFLYTYYGINKVLLGAVILITMFTTIRFIFFLYASLVIVPRRKKAAYYRSAANATVTVLVPAYNEAENIRATLLSILANSRPPDEVLVINDGSTDDTAAYAQEVATHYPNQIRVITVPNGGKAEALNEGIRLATSDIIVAIDGDTVLDRMCIENVLVPFQSEKVGAAAGKIVPASVKTLLEKYQNLEYLIGQNMDKTIIGLIGAVNIVPGAIGAWRRSILIEVGGYSTETLVEDQDLTLAVLALGYRVEYVPDAIAYTEVPTSFRSFYMQRFRWTYGTFQCMWKYRTRICSDSNVRLGWVALPYAFIFNVLLPVIALLLYFAIALGALMQLTQPAVFVLVIFTILDIFYAFVALRAESRAQIAQIPHIILQRFVYIVIYAWLALTVALKVLDGSKTRWNKLKRSGNAQQRYFDSLSQPSSHDTEGVRVPAHSDYDPVIVSLQGPFGTAAPSTNLQ